MKSKFKVGNLVKLVKGAAKHLKSVSQNSDIPLEEDRLYTVIQVHICACGVEYVQLLGVEHTGKGVGAIYCTDGSVIAEVKPGDNHLLAAIRFEIASIIDVACLDHDLFEPIPMIKELINSDLPFDMYTNQGDITFALGKSRSKSE